MYCILVIKSEQCEYKYCIFGTMEKMPPTTTTMTTKRRITPWAKSKAKQLLADDIVRGTVTPVMRPIDIYEMHQEYKNYKIDNFRTNLRNLRKSIKKDKCCADSDRDALAHDLQVRHPHVDILLRSTPFWMGSEAQKLLKKDVDAGRHEKMKPWDLWISKVAYQAFPLEVFRKHIYQEVRCRKENAYWRVKKERGL
jgi:hypothetical protein